jgi:hypothetical protein
MLITPPEQPVVYIVEMDCNNKQAEKLIPGNLLHGIDMVSLVSHELSDDIFALKSACAILNSIISDKTGLKIAYAPTHYAPSADLAEHVIRSEDGTVESIGGFTDPFEMVNIVLLNNHNEQIGEARIRMVDFEMVQTVDEIINHKILVH